ncbi:MAG: hypothetical protein H0X33_08485 [Taibaiella sp.]|nr:hypothetical protein [Taibaiella sp.]
MLLKILSFRQYLMCSMVFLCITLYSCSKSSNNAPSTPPQIAFKQISGYVYHDTTITQNTYFRVGIESSRVSGSDLLKYLYIYASYDGKPDSLINYIHLYGATADSYNDVLGFVSRNQGGTEKYTFTILTQGGLTNSVSATVNVH